MSRANPFHPLSDVWIGSTDHPPTKEFPGGMPNPPAPIASGLEHLEPKPPQPEAQPELPQAAPAEEADAEAEE